MVIIIITLDAKTENISIAAYKIDKNVNIYKIMTDELKREQGLPINLYIWI